MFEKAKDRELDNFLQTKAIENTAIFNKLKKVYNDSLAKAGNMDTRRSKALIRLQNAVSTLKHQVHKMNERFQSMEDRGKYEVFQPN